MIVSDLDVCPNLFLVTLSVIIVVSLIAVILTRLWVTQLGWRLEEGLELDHRLVPLRNALTVLRDAVNQAHLVSEELETLGQLREEMATALVEVRRIQDDFVEAYNAKLEHIETHKETLAELVSGLNWLLQKMGEAYLLLPRQRVTGDGLVEFLEAHNYRVNVKLRSLIKEYYNGESSGLTGEQHDLGGEA